MRIFVLGWYRHGNIGDDSYQITFPRLFPNHSFEFSDHLHSNIDADAIFLGGGNVMNSYFLSQLEGIKNIPIYGMSVGVEKPFKEKVAFKHIFARENHSIDILKSQGIPCSLAPDFGLTLSGHKDEGIKFIENIFHKNNLDLYQKKISIILNGHLICGDETSNASQSINFLNFSYKLSRVIDSTMASFIFLPSFGKQ